MTHSSAIVVQEFSDLLKQYRVWTVYGDKYTGEFPRELFRKRGIQYTQASKPKSDIYLELLPAMNSRRVDLLDHPKLTNQLVSLERRTARGGKDSIDHAPGAHDDLANAVAGAIWMVLSDKALPIVCPEIVTVPRYYFEPSPDWR
jgi:hypothetical protein